MSSKVTIKMNDVSLIEVFDEIKSQTGYKFMYKSSDVNEQQKISITKLNSEIKVVLDELFTKTNLTYVLKGKQVLVSKKKEINTKTQKKKKTISGIILDEFGDPLPGVNIVVKGTTIGTMTGINGEYELAVGEGNPEIVVSYLGYSTIVFKANQQKSSIQLQEDSQALEEVVVIGYGQVKKEDATGSVVAISTKDHEKGGVATAQEMLSGKVAGVSITTDGGAPGSGATIRIRGGSSLSASNNPLFVIDGVPLDDEGVSGMRNPLNTINPNDIETFTVLKDASATAIYGSRASNGVILITTKKSKLGSKLKFELNSKMSISNVIETIDVMDANQYRDILNKVWGADQDIIALLGNANTDWQDEIYQMAIGHEHNFNIGGSALGFLPYRVSIGYSDKEGVLKTSEAKRTNLNLVLNPSFFDGHLKTNLNLKGVYVDNRFADQGAIGSAVNFDPTQPVYDPNNVSGYWGWTTNTTNENGDPIVVQKSLAPNNPVAQLELHSNTSDVYRSIGNIQLDYKIHGFEQVNMNLNVGYDYSDTEGDDVTPNTALWQVNTKHVGGSVGKYEQEKKNELLDFYIGYNDEYKPAFSKVNAMLGYSWQHYYRKGSSLYQNMDGSQVFSNEDYETESYLVSFFGRLNYTFMDRYLLTATFRRDGTSRFHEDSRWGLFPSYAFAWKIGEEPFMKDLDFLSDMKLRLGYGVTGQQNIGSGDYPYLPLYEFSGNFARYQFGYNEDGSPRYVKTLRPNGYDEKLKWEETTTYNAGLDFSFLKNRITASFDFYKRETKDLLNTIDIPAGSNLTNRILTNVGNLENSGYEVTLTGVALSTKDLEWTLSYNFTYNKNEITKLTTADDPSYKGVETGGISGGVGNNVQINSVGYPVNSFYVYQQKYFKGKPLEGEYVDRDKSGTISSDGDKYRYEKASPDYTMGFSSSLKYKDFDFNFAGRVSLGNHVYNNVASTRDNLNALGATSGFLTNLSTSYYKSEFRRAQYFSDFYIEDASFLKIDNMSLGYTLRNLLSESDNLRLFFTVQNVLTVTDYSGIDPEVFGGIDNNLYPRPRTFVFGFNFNF
jgi:iron complex outermembrane receptor protein